MAKARQKTLDELAVEIQHSAHIGDFKQRIGTFEKLYKTDNQFLPIVQEHANDIVFGNPTNREEFPGAYELSYKVLDKEVRGDNTKVNDEGILAKMLETYVDTFLEKVMKGKFKTSLGEAEAQGASKEKIREMKGMLFSHYVADDQGNPVNPLNPQFINQLKGRSKVELINSLRNISQQTVGGYARFWIANVGRDLIKHEDHGEVAPYVQQKMKESGFMHDDPHYHITKNALQLATEYGHLLTGNLQPLQRAGYKTQAQRGGGDHQGEGQH